MAKRKSKSRSVTILAINGSPRRKNNTSIILEEAIKGAQEVDTVQVDLFEFASKRSRAAGATASPTVSGRGNVSSRMTSTG